MTDKPQQPRREERRLSQHSYTGNDRRKEEHVYDQPMMAGEERRESTGSDGTDALKDQAP